MTDTTTQSETENDSENENDCEACAALGGALPCAECYIFGGKDSQEVA